MYTHRKTQFDLIGQDIHNINELTILQNIFYHSLFSIYKTLNCSLNGERYIEIFDTNDSSLFIFTHLLFKGEALHNGIFSKQ